MTANALQPGCDEFDMPEMSYQPGECMTIADRAVLVTGANEGEL